MMKIDIFNNGRRQGQCIFYFVFEKHAQYTAQYIHILFFYIVNLTLSYFKRSHYLSHFN